MKRNIDDSSIEFRIIYCIALFTAISNPVKCKKCDEYTKFQTTSNSGLGFKVVGSCDNYVNESIRIK